MIKTAFFSTFLLITAFSQGQEYSLKFDSLRNNTDKTELLYIDKNFNYTKQLKLFPDSVFEYSFDRCGSCDVSWGHWRIENDSIIILNSNYFLSDSLLKENRKVIEWYRYRDYKHFENKKFYRINGSLYELNIHNPMNIAALCVGKEFEFTSDSTKKGLKALKIKLKNTQDKKFHSIGYGMVRSTTIQEDGTYCLSLYFKKGFHVIYKGFIYTNLSKGEEVSTNQNLGSPSNEIEIIILAPKRSIDYKIIEESLFKK